MYFIVRLLFAELIFWGAHAKVLIGVLSCTRRKLQRFVFLLQ